MIRGPPIWNSGFSSPGISAEQYDCKVRIDPKSIVGGYERGEAEAVVRTSLYFRARNVRRAKLWRSICPTICLSRRISLLWIVGALWSKLGWDKSRVDKEVDDIIERSEPVGA